MHKTAKPPKESPLLSRQELWPAHAIFLSADLCYLRLMAINIPRP